MIIAVTGASGFIGSQLSHYLRNRGYDVLALVRSLEKAESLKAAGLHTQICDITDKQSLEEAFQGVEIVIHVAALFNRPDASWEEYHRVNVEGTRNVLEAAKECGVKKVLHCSTVGVAVGKGFPPFSENNPYSPPSWDKYETTKCEGEQIAVNFYQNTGFPLVIIRPAQVYGPGDKGKVKFYRMVKKGIIVNPGNTYKHLIFIDDLCRAFELAMEKEEGIGKIFIIAGEKAITLRELIAIAAKQLGVSPPRVIIPAHPMIWLCTITENMCNLLRIKPILFRRSMDFFTKSVKFDTINAKQFLGFESKTDISTGVKKTIFWYKENGLL